MDDPRKSECPGCGAPPSVTVGAPFVGAVGVLWWKRPFEEQLYRCAELAAAFQFVSSSNGSAHTQLETSGHEGVRYLGWTQ